jgi:tetratricopeptide (TPR) repeat protein
LGFVSISRGRRIRERETQSLALPVVFNASAVLLAFLLLFSSNGATQPAGTDPNKRLYRADVLIRQGKLDDAISLLKDLRQTQPQPSGVEAKLGKAYYQKRSFQEAIAHFKIALEQNPGDLEAVQLLALSFYSVGEVQEAIPLLEKVRARVPESQSDTAYLLGVCYLKTQQLDKARAAFGQMFSVAPGSAMAHMMLAKMMVRQKLEEQSVPEIHKALELDPRLPMAHFLLGEIYLYQTNPQRALEEFKKELEINPTVWLVYWRLGDAYTRLEKYDEAEKVLKEAVWLNESFTGSYLLLGEVELKKGNPELGAGFLERALKLDPQNDYTHYSLARAYQQMGRTEEANRHFEITRSLRAEKKSDEQRLFQDITR